MKIKSLLSLSLLASGTTFTMAAVTPVTSVSASGANLQVGTITVGSSVYPRVELATGTTTNSASPTPAALPNMDDFFLATGHGNVGNSGGAGLSLPVRTILFGGGNFTSVATVAKPADFFIFEAGSGDAINVAPIFPDDTIGQNTAISGASWANTGLAGVFQSQNVMGSSFSITDLLDAGGTPLTAATAIKGIAITTGGGVDPVGIFAVVAPPAVFYDHLDVVPDLTPPPVAGDTFEVVITARDANNVKVNDSTLTVTVTSPTTGSLMEFDWNGDTVFGDNSGTLVNGERTIKARNKKAQTVTVVATQGAVTTTSPPLITIAAGPINQLQTLVPGETAAPGTATGKTGVPAGQLQGVPFSVSVRAVDANWNLVSSTRSIGITSSDSLATLPPNAPLFEGSASFNVTLNQSATPYTVTATDLTIGGVGSGVSAPVTTAQLYRWLGTTNSWDTSAINWVSPPSVTPVAYPDGTLAVFDDVGAANPNVNVGAVTPSGIIVNSATTNYKFQSGGIGGTATLTKAGASTLSLTEENTYTGATTVTGGVLELINARALPGGNASVGGTSNLNLNGGVVGLYSDFFRNLDAGSEGVRLSGTNSGFASFDQSDGESIVDLTQTNPDLTTARVVLTFGTTNFLPASSDVLVLSHSTAKGTLAIENFIDFGAGGDRTIRVDNGEALVDAVLRGRLQDTSASPGNLVKTGTGTLELAFASNNYEGSTKIQNGKLIIANGGIYAGVNPTRARTVTLGSGTDSGVLQLGDENFQKSQTIGGLLVSGTGSANAVVGGNDTTSVLTINNSSGEVIYSGRLGGSGGSENNLGLIKAAGGTLTLTGLNNTYNGTTSITDGVLALGANHVLSGGLKIGSTTSANTATLNVGAFNHTFGPIDPTAANAKINLSGGTIAFEDSSGEDWAGGVLDITGNFVSGVSVRFGTDEFGLTPDQLLQIRIGGNLGTYTLDENGYLSNGSVAHPYDTWSGGASFDTDANNDGVENGLAWLLGAINPNVNANGLLPVVTQTSGSLKLTFNMLAVRGTAQLHLEHSSDLGIADAWTSVPVPDVSGGVAPVTFVVTGTGPLNVQATVSSSEAAAGKLFGRLKAVK